MTLLEIVQAACREMALPIPNGVASATDKQTTQMYGLMNALGADLVTDYDWQRLQALATITTVASTAAYALPSDYSHQLNQTHWDATNSWPMAGPVPPQGWNWLQYSGISGGAGARSRYRIVGNLVSIHPTPSDVRTLNYSYIKKNWVIDDDGSTEKAAFDGDSDTCVYRDRLMVCGLKWKFYEAKGLDTGAVLRDYLVQLEKAKGQDAGAPVLDLSGRQSGVWIAGWANIPDRGYG